MVNAFLLNAIEAESIKARVIQSVIAVSRKDLERRMDATTCPATKQAIDDAQILELDGKRKPASTRITTCERDKPK